MLLVRVATGLVLASILSASIFMLPKAVTVALFLLFVFVGALEWAKIAGFGTNVARVAYAAAMVVASAVSCWLTRAPAVYLAVLITGAMWWLVALAWIISYQLHGRPVIRHVTVIAVLGALVFIPAICAISALLEHSPIQLSLLFAIVWSADVLAYFGGRRFGRRRLASRVSPGKTWEGLGCALVGTLILGLGLNTATLMASAATVTMIVLMTFVAAVVGDLFESLSKRISGVKDSGTILPGHGGVMDRIDSLVAAAPIFALALHTQGYT